MSESERERESVCVCESERGGNLYLREGGKRGEDHVTQ